MFRFRVHMWVKSYSVCLSPSYFIWHNTFKVHLLLLFSRSVMSDSLQPNGLQHTFTISWSLLKLMSIELVMPSNHLILCHPFSSCLQSFLASGSFLTSHLFQWGGQTIGASASASVLPMNTQDWYPLGLTDLISCNPRDSQEFSPAPQIKSINSSAFSLLYSPTLIHT